MHKAGKNRDKLTVFGAGLTQDKTQRIEALFEKRKKEET